MIQNLIYGVWSSAFSYRFSSRKSQRQQKLAKRITRFTIPFRSKSHSFYEPQLTQHYKKCTPATQPKTLLTLQFTKFTQFPSKHVSGLCQKIFCTASFLDTQELHSGSN